MNFTHRALRSSLSWLRFPWQSFFLSSTLQCEPKEQPGQRQAKHATVTQLLKMDSTAPSLSHLRPIPRVPWTQSEEPAALGKKQHTFRFSDSSQYSAMQIHIASAFRCATNFHTHYTFLITCKCFIYADVTVTRAVISLFLSDSDHTGKDTAFVLNLWNMLTHYKAHYLRFLCLSLSCLWSGNLEEGSGSKMKIQNKWTKWVINLHGLQKWLD